MATKKKMLQAAAGQAGGAGLDITDVFSTYLYTGNGSTQTITNGIDLDGEGGLVWMQVRDVTGGNRLVDSENGNNYLRTHNTSDLTDIGSPAFTLNANGFTVPNGATAWNGSGNDIASWTFRKAPKFFDVVTWTGTSGNRTIPHNLQTTVGTIIVKETTTTGNWFVYHKDRPSTSDLLLLNTTGSYPDYNGATNFPTEPTSTDFFVDPNLNGLGTGYVAYLFAHNDGDGEFGPNGDQDIIKCGSYTGAGSEGSPEVTLGWEPQWLLIKNVSSGSTNWVLVDSMRGLPVGSDSEVLYANTSGSTSGFRVAELTATGFKLGQNISYINQSGNTYIYIAIRRGPLAPPESATEVFALQQDNFDSSAPAFRSDFPVDFAIERRVNSSTLNNSIVPRLTAPLYLETDTLVVENSDAEYAFDYNNGWNSQPNQGADIIAYMWKRAPNFCDVLAYKGNGVAGHSITHNLGVAPEMIWVKNRGTTNKSWNAYLGPLGLSGGAPAYAVLNETDAAAYSTTRFYTTPTATEFSVGSNSRLNTSGDDYIAYLFASLPGISKVGSYTGDGTSGRVIDCGFTTGARFILIKRTNNIGSWNLWDSVRGIVTGNDPYIELNINNAEVTTTDYIDPDASGFIVNNNNRTNRSGDTYIFYAIA